MPQPEWAASQRRPALSSSTAGVPELARSAFKLLHMAISTVLGNRPKGYFIPYRHAAEMPPPGATAYPAVEELFNAAGERQREFLSNINKYTEVIEKIGENNPPEPRWDQDWFPRMDAVAAYVMVREFRPRRIIEVGSGHSTRFMARAVRDGVLSTRITAVDPGPRAMIDGLDVETVSKLVHEVPPELFGELGAGDILFIDSSHILMPGTDVDYLFNSVLPRLPSGVLIHIHDILLPDPYPDTWTWRGYNEQLGAAALLQGGAYEILFSSHYAVTRLQNSFEETVAAGLPLNKGALETSLWLRRL